MIHSVLLAMTDGRCWFAVREKLRWLELIWCERKVLTNEWTRLNVYVLRGLMTKFRFLFPWGWQRDKKQQAAKASERSSHERSFIVSITRRPAAMVWFLQIKPSLASLETERKKTKDMYRLWKVQDSQLLTFSPHILVDQNYTTRLAVYIYSLLYHLCWLVGTKVTWGNLFSLVARCDIHACTRFSYFNLVRI